MARNIFAAVDRLGAIRAQIADLRKQQEDIEAEVRAAIEAQYPGNAADQVLDGSLFRVRLVVQFRETLIAAKVREYLSPQQLVHAVRVTEVQSLRVTARSTEKLKEAA